MILLNTLSSEISWPISIKFHADPTVETGLRVCSNGHVPLTDMLIYGKLMIIIIIIIIIKTTHRSSLKPRTALIMIPSLVARTGLEKCCLTSAYLQWLFYSGKRAVVRGPLVLLS